MLFRSIPTGFDKSQIVQVPVNSVVVMSTTHLPLLDKLGLIDRLIGVSDFKQINTPSVVAKIKAGKLQEVGRSNSTNVEKVLEIRPDLVTTYGIGNSKSDSHPKLIKAGLPVAIVGEYMESSPLGRAEWLKFMGYFLTVKLKLRQNFRRSRVSINRSPKLPDKLKINPQFFQVSIVAVLGIFLAAIVIQQNLLKMQAGNISGMKIDRLVV